MSYAERKKLAMTENIARAKLRQEATRIFDEGQKDGIYKSFCLIYWALHDKFGFGEKRIKQLHAEAIKLLDYDEVSMRDIEAALLDECNIKISDIWRD